MVKPNYRINVFSVKSLFEGALNVKSGKETPLNIDAEWTIESLIARKEMGENSLFYQICRHKLEQQYANDLTRVENEIQNLRSSNLEASDFIVGDLIYLNFEGVFDDVGNLIDESNAPLLVALFEQGIIIDFNNQKTHYLSFEKSNGMSKNKMLSFIRKEYKNPIHERIMMGIPLDSQNFVLNKLFAYNGLMLSDGYRIDGLKRRDESDVAFNEDSIVLISDVTKYQKADYKTVFNF